jgi:diguanylate cyclase (GGDEF)-like protein
MSPERSRPDSKTVELILESLPVVAWFTDADYRVTWSCGGAARFLGADETTDGDHDVRALLGGRHPLAAAHEAALAGATIDIEMPSKGRSYAMRVQPLRDARATIIGCIGSGYDITDGRPSETTIFYHAAFDPLTGLLNRGHFRNRLTRELFQARRAPKELTLAVVSIDDFDDIVRAHTSAVGDEFLHIVVSRISAAVPRSIVVGRIEPDAFGLILPSGAFDEVRAMTDAMLSQFDDSILAGDAELHATISIGTATFPFDGRTAEHLMRASTAAVRRAQQLGGRRSQYFFSALASDSIHVSEVDHDIWSAVDREDLFLVYQPQVTIAGRAVETMEALLRWKKDGNVLPAATIIPRLEENALIVPLGRWIIETALRQYVTWRAGGIDLAKISLNIGARQLADESFVPALRRSLARHDIDPARIDIEINEAAAAVDTDAAIRALSALRELGTGIILDDFGSRTSSLDALRRLPVTGLKIDRSFTAAIPGCRSAQAIISALLAAAGDLDLRVAAEGVETAAQAAWLLGAGCTSAQGFFFSQPLAGDDAARFLQVRSTR